MRERHPGPKDAISGWTLTVARQPTIHIRLLLKMALDAKPHLEFILLEPVHGLDLAVTSLALDIAVDVSLVVEQNVLRHIVHLHPWRGCPGVEIVMLFLDPGVVGDDILVAMQTLLHRRQPRMVGIIHIGMAIPTLDLLNPGMEAVAERNGLFQTGVRARRKIIEIKQRDDQHHRGRSGQYGYEISTQKSPNPLT